VGEPYAGIGSRETPPAVIELIESIGVAMAERGCVLRTGASPGADQAFFRGAIAGCGRVELYLPWPDFEAGSWSGAESDRVEVHPRPSPAACAVSADVHPSWSSLGEPERLLLARDAHQALGADLHTPARLVVCWTADGSAGGWGATADGTHHALRIAERHGVPVFNLARPDRAAAIGAMIARTDRDG